MLTLFLVLKDITKEEEVTKTKTTAKRTIGITNSSLTTLNGKKTNTSTLERGGIDISQRSHHKFTGSLWHCYLHASKVQPMHQTIWWDALVEKRSPIRKWIVSTISKKSETKLMWARSWPTILRMTFIWLIVKVAIQSSLQSPSSSEARTARWGRRLP